MSIAYTGFLEVSWNLMILHSRYLLVEAKICSKNTMMQACRMTSAASCCHAGGLHLRSGMDSVSLEATPVVQQSSVM